MLLDFEEMLHSRSRVLLVLLLFQCGFAVGQDASAANTLKTIKNSDVEWKGISFGRAGPVIVGESAKAANEKGVTVAPELIAMLDDADSFVAAHVLLTELWRIPDVDKERICTPISTGYFLSYNGLILRLEWKEENGQIVKSATMPDLDCQRKRIRNWWKDRRRTNPAEFSPMTRVD